MDKGGKVVGCHPTKDKAINHMQALYANVPDASKADTPMDVAYDPIVTDPEPANPSSHINPNAGMRKPQYMTNFGRQLGGGIHDKRIVDIWTIKSDDGIIPTPTYQEQQGNYGQQTQEKPEQSESWFNFRNTRPTKNTYRVEE